MAELLTGFGYSRVQIDGALDLSGAQWCLDTLANKSIYVRSDGEVVLGAEPPAVLDVATIPWGQARKIHKSLLDALHLQTLGSLRDLFAGSERDLARLHSCSGEVSHR